MYSVALIATLALIQITAPAADSTALANDVGTLASAQTNEARFDALTAMLRARNLPFAVESFTIPSRIGTEPRTEGRNVVVTIGEGPEELVLGAHYDAARLSDGTLSRGAVDNAASSVILVRVAEALRQTPPAMRVRVVWFDMEELGLLGSVKYIENHRTERIAGMLNFDVNGYGDTVLFGPEQPRNERFREALRRSCVEQRRECVSFPQMPPGDDRSFSKADVPSVSIASLPAVEVHQLWLLMNTTESGLAPGHLPAILKTIHTPEDTLAKLNPDTLTRMMALAISLVRNIAIRPMP
jgi:Zn-dependent M28 family amino/carboxypeptidase